MASWLDAYCQLYGYGSCGSVPLADAPMVWGGTALGVCAAILAFYAAVMRPS